MIVPDWVRKNVVFIGFKMANGEPRFMGSGFFLGRATSDYSGSGAGIATGIRLITAKHVIDEIKKLGISKVSIRVNTKAGAAIWFDSDSSDWKFHPTDPSVDVAMLRCGIHNDLDHFAVPTLVCATPKVFTENEVGLGDEVFIVGLFRHHHGENRNIPIVRVGNLAALNEEKVQTKEFGLIDAYLVEARSIGGLSGSPVFLNLGIVRQIRGQVVQKPEPGPMMFLLGLVHGHYDVPSVELDTNVQDSGKSLSVEKINTGIAMVVPIEKIMEAFNVHSPMNG